MATPDQAPKCRNLVLDAGPLLSLSPLRGLAETYLTTPQVLAELKDSRAREHFQRLGLLSGVKIEIRSPDAASLAHVIQWAKKTGDYAVLSHPDLCVLALTYALSEEDKKKKQKEKEDAKKAGAETQPEGTEPAAAESDAVAAPSEPVEAESATVTIEDVTEQLDETHLEGSETQPVDESTLQDEAVVPDATEDEAPLEPLDVEITPIENDDAPRQPQPQSQSAPEPEQDPEADPSAESSPSPSRSSPSPIYDDPSDEDDGEGEWITPANVGIHKSRALNQLPDEDDGSKKGSKKKADEATQIGAGCMTADFAMQNVLLQMGLNLVGLEGKRIERIKSWVLRCHACFKICKDNSKKFCPSCGNPTLLRASVTVAAPGASKSAPIMQVHLKPNFQYKTRGTIYSIPQPKAGSAKTGPGTGLILREDQIEYVRAKKRADGKREREEQRLLKGVMSRGVDSNGRGGATSSWMDPDWVPEIIAAGSGGKGRSSRSAGMDGDMPQIGYGRKNPNEKRRKK